MDWLPKYVSFTFWATYLYLHGLGYLFTIPLYTGLPYILGYSCKLGLHCCRMAAEFVSESFRIFTCMVLYTIYQFAPASNPTSEPSNVKKSINNHINDNKAMRSQRVLQVTSSWDRPGPFFGTDLVLFFHRKHSVS